MTDNTKRRLLSEAKTSVTDCNRLLSRVESAISVDDLQSIESAANQASQAAKELNQLAGMLRYERIKS